MRKRENLNDRLRSELVENVKRNINSEDPSHDILHTLRVLSNAENISKEEGGDLDVVTPAALFHDIVCYPKNSPKNRFSVKESAEYAETILTKMPEYPQEKIKRVKSAILSTSFTYGKETESIEDEIVQAADMLDAVGVISVMRTYGSSGVMKRAFYEPNDPFAEHRELDDMKYGLDLFYTRLLTIQDKIKTKTAQKIAKRRTMILVKILDEFRKELQGK